MSKLLRSPLWVVPFLLVSSIAEMGMASANPNQQEIQKKSNDEIHLTQLQIGDRSLPETSAINIGDSLQQPDETSMPQVTSVSQLSDVQPTDWAFQALQSLVERYGCIAGYPNGTYRGNRAMTRYEFAAGLNACLERVNELIATGTADLVRKEDFESIRKLSEEFADGLTELRGRIDPLEQRTAVLESQQFSSTTKLQAEVIVSLGGVFGGDRALNSDQWRNIEAATTPAQRETRKATAFGAAGSRLQDNTILSDRIRVNLVSSFTGKDQLFTRLEANNTTAFSGAVTGTNMTRASWDGNNGNDVVMGKLFYRFPVGDKINVIVDAIGGEFYDNFNTVNPLLSSVPIGSVSRFGRFSPIYRASNTGSGQNVGSGVSAIFKISDQITLSGGYIARRGNEPTSGRGLFDGSYGTLAQLAFQPNKDATLALTYAHSYLSGVAGDVTVSGSYGSAFANTPFGAAIATSANHYGVQASYRFHPKFMLSGWGGYTQATAEVSSGTNSTTNQVNKGDKADIWNWAVTLAFPDLGKKGNLGGIIFGQPPKVTSNDFGSTILTPTTARRKDADTSFHLEALYRYQVNPNLSITPGLIVIFNPEHNSNNDTIYTGVIRTTFRF
ncbi:iron uptake porin [Calothrix sp. UHCC 0171]|uniref:iron uptake porin n=1 Tax=Calothrix sp. UHCC 0171 TaxID=3110245 RepID=UPI002B2202B1|nr:iron uptake porin [Calothrix sp. UHCC 0171]MEA5572900.1 iron uptake porin [Calothrix sp. UHCC 0171]